jgi:PPOX class probable F420-dependent enzyme
VPNSVIPESHRDLLDICPVVTMATLGPDSFPQVSNMWFLIEEDGTIAASLNTSRQKVKNLRRHPEAALLFVAPGNPYRTLEIRARAAITPDPDYAFADRVGA